MAKTDGKEAISINLDSDLIVAIDELGQKEDRNRSNMTQVLLREAISYRDRDVERDV